MRLFYIILGFIVLFLIGLVFYARIAITQAKVVIEWSTASELDTVGFNIYRSETSAGPGILVNRDLIPPAEDSQVGGNYRYVDANVVPGRVYYYFLEDISINGSVNTNGPVVVKAQANVELFWIIVILLAAIFAFILLRMVWPRGKADKRGDG